MPRLKVDTLHFGDPGFRKLRQLEVPIADRLTIIGGHNGIGKSSILALIANGSGLTASKPQSYLGQRFNANIYEIIYLDYEQEFEAPEALPGKASIRLTYSIDGVQLNKKCTLTPRNDRKELRVVPRNEPHQEVSISGITIGTESKVPLPTIYLGMTRMLPIGESNPEWVTSRHDANFSAEDASFIREFMNKVIPASSPDASEMTITTQSIQGTSKTGKHPAYGHSPKAISVGQDSLNSIATALASFQRLERESSAYHGGLLVIDEIDAGLHPSAQRHLIQEVRSAARRLKVQVVATTHSMPLIELVHRESMPAAARHTHPDSVIYLADTRKPMVFQDQSLSAIRADMSLIAPTFAKRSRDEVKVYLEDPEAFDFFRVLLTRRVRDKVRRTTGVNLKPIPLSVGCENLKGFQKHDPYFKQVAIVLDADARLGPQGPKNISKLPGGISAADGKNNPENTIFRFVKEIVDGDSYPAVLDRLHARNITTDQLQEHLLEGFDELEIGDRERAKSWYQLRKKLIADWQLIEEWANEHQAAVDEFVANFVESVSAAHAAWQV